MSNRPNGVLYIGVTNNLVRRCYEHRNGIIDGFTKQHDLKRLVYYESYDDIRIAIQREEHETLVAGMEGAAHQWFQSRMGRSLRLDRVRRGWPGQARP